MTQSTHVINGKDGRSILIDELNENNSTKIVLFAHGFKGYKDWGPWNIVQEEFAKQGFHFIKFNFSHNGGTIDNPIDFPDLEAFGNNTYSIEQRDLTCVINWIEENYSNKEICLIGHSRGGGASILKAASDKRIKKLITWASVSTLERWNKDTLEQWKEQGVQFQLNSRTKQNMPLYWSLAEDFYNNINDLNIENACKAISIPALIIHGTNDKAVTFDAAQNLHKWISNSKLLQIENGNHTFGGKHPWLEKNLPKDLETAVLQTIEFIQ